MAKNKFLLFTDSDIEKVVGKVESPTLSKLPKNVPFTSSCTTYFCTNFGCQENSEDINEENQSDTDYSEIFPYKK